jgi:hypothetical protein
MGSTYESVRAEFNSRAAILAEDGRNQRLWQHQKSPTRDQHTDDMVRWAFFNQTRRTETQNNRESTDDAYLRETIMWIVTQVREDEKRRYAEQLAKGFKVLFGEEATGLAYAIATDLGLLDE